MSFLTSTRSKLIGAPFNRRPGVLVTASLLATLLPQACGAKPNDWAPSPLEVVSENVHVSVGEKLALVVGRYWLQYVAKFDDPASPRVAIYYATFVPKAYANREDLLELSGVRLMLGDKAISPETARILSDEEVGPIQVAPKDFAVAWFIFQLPRDAAKMRFDVLIESAQPVYTYEGKSVAAYLPWLPEYEGTRKELELKDSDYVVTFEALPHVAIKPESINSKVVESTATKLVVHPVHLENIAVSVTQSAP